MSAQRADDLLGDRDRIAALDRDPHLARVQTARPENVVDDAGEPVGFARDHVEQSGALRLLQSYVVALERQGGTVDRGKRRAELVRDGGDEVALQLLDGALVRHVAE